MRIAYVSLYDPADRNAWSGLIRGIHDSLVKAGAEVDVVWGMKESRATRLKTGIRKWIYRKVLGQEFPRNRDPAYLSEIARQADAQLAGKHYDFIFAPSSLNIAAMKTATPKAFWTDATFGGMVGFYADFTGLAPAALRQGHAQEQTGLSQAALAFYSSTWAAETALAHYDVAPDKVHAVGFGANIPEAAAPLDLPARMAARPMLLHVGVDFIRKGGDKAVAAAAELRARGIDVELHIVGTTPPEPLPDWVVLHGFLSKNNPEHWAKLSALFAQSRFLLVPSVAECFGVVFVEAAAFGLPSLATDVGGIPSAIEEGISGFTLPLEASGVAYADAMEPYFRDPALYERLCLSSLEAYEQRMSWDRRGEQVLKIMSDYLEKRQPAKA